MAHNIKRTGELVEAYSTPDPRKVEYKFPAKVEEYFEQYSRYYKQNTEFLFSKIYKKEISIYLSELESEFFNDLIEEYKLNSISHVLICAFYKIRTYDVNDPEKTLMHFFNEMKDLNELLEKLETGQLNLLGVRLSFDKKFKKDKSFSLSSPQLIDYIMNSLKIHKELSSTKDSLAEGRSLKELGKKISNRFQSARKLAQYHWAQLLVDLLTSDNVLSQLNKELTERETYIIASKLINLGQLGDYRDGLFDVSDDQYYDQVRTKFAKMR